MREGERRQDVRARVKVRSTEDVELGRGGRLKWRAAECRKGEGQERQEREREEEKEERGTVAARHTSPPFQQYLNRYSISARERQSECVLFLDRYQRIVETSFAVSRCGNGNFCLFQISFAPGSNAYQAPLTSFPRPLSSSRNACLFLPGALHVQRSSVYNGLRVLPLEARAVGQRKRGTAGAEACGKGQAVGSG